MLSDSQAKSWRSKVCHIQTANRYNTDLQRPHAGKSFTFTFSAPRSQVPRIDDGVGCDASGISKCFSCFAILQQVYAPFASLGPACVLKSNKNSGSLNTAQLSLWWVGGWLGAVSWPKNVDNKKESEPKCPLVSKECQPNTSPESFQLTPKQAAQSNIKCCDKTLTHSHTHVFAHTCAKRTRGPALEI